MAYFHVFTMNSVPWPGLRDMIWAGSLSFNLLKFNKEPTGVNVVNNPKYFQCLKTMGHLRRIQFTTLFNIQIEEIAGMNSRAVAVIPNTNVTY